MVVIGVCVALVAAGIVLALRGHDRPPARGWRYVALSLAAGLGAGVLAAGAGGRLLMRLLAVTSPDADGTLTEGGATVGDVTLDGTLGFFVFAGLPAGLLSGALYALVAPLLPSRGARGLAVGLLLLVLAATRIDPLRTDNFDFLLLEPAWLAVVGFSVLALFQGILVAALAPSPRAAPERRTLIAGRVALAAVLIAALPGFLDATGEILSS